jgi:hypothetical protein
MTRYGRPPFAHHFPASSNASALLAIGTAASIGLASLLLGTYVFRNYGFALFCGVPLLLGFLCPLLHGMGAPRSFGNMLAVNTLCQLTLMCSLLGFGIEGLGCLFMCAPLWFLCALVGTAFALPIHERLWRGWQTPRGFPIIGLLLVFSAPLLMGVEHLADLQPDLVPVTTSLDIDAPPADVWQALLAFPELPPPNDWVFSLGVAYPRHATITGHGIGAVRHCVFSTGAFVEPITAWDEHRLLAFDVIESPPTMQELSPYPDLHPPHLEGYFLSRRGQFKLIDLGNGRTRLEGTTWYQNRMAPAFYWRLWSDTILHRIHHQVLSHIRTISETRHHR